MRLEYYYLVFENCSELCPGELFESILSFLKVVFSVYGYTLWAPGDIYDMHVVCEDNAQRSLYWSLPPHYRDKITKRRVVVKGVYSFTKELKKNLLDHDDLCVVDNTFEVFGERD